MTALDRYQRAEALADLREVSGPVDADTAELYIDQIVAEYRRDGAMEAWREELRGDLSRAGLI